MATGTIKRIVADRGFGFIAADDEKEYFFHRGGLDGTLEFDRLVGGEKVEFDIEASPKGPRANRVRAA
jgi:cold shock protein